jgi:ribosomal protein S18 acetylase RimI-like enzyme
MLWGFIATSIAARAHGKTGTKMADDAMIWRMERAFLLAWPAPRRETIGDWLVQFAPGVSRRANSANPSRFPIRDLDSTMAECERRYRAANQPVLFRVLSTTESAVAKRLDQLGYTSEGETTTLHAPIEATERVRDSEVLLTAKPEAVWLDTMTSAQGHTGERASTYRAIVGAIALPTAFVALRHEDQLASLAYGAIHDGFMMCESVITRAAYRNRGYVRRLLTTLFAWGAEQKAQTVCLQVQTDNTPAVALYRGLGLKNTLYSYHYRRAPSAIS